MDHDFDVDLKSVALLFFKVVNSPEFVDLAPIQIYASCSTTGGAARSMGHQVTPELEELVHGTSAEALNEALTWAENEFGSVSGYLLAHGLTPEDLSALRARLVHGGSSEGVRASAK